MSTEDEFVRRYLAPLASGHSASLDLADDCACLSPPPGRDLVLKTDPIIAGLHFFADDAPADIAWKALAVNISDLAAKAATPDCYLMSLTFPAPPQDDWMQSFAQGLAAAQDALGCHLIGGDTDISPNSKLTISITVIGTVAAGKMVRRASAKPGDVLFVSGTIGDAALGLAIRKAHGSDSIRGQLSASDQKYLLKRYSRPEPRIGLSQALATYAGAAMDLSDGLIKDAQRMCRASGIDATLEAAKVPVSAPAQRWLSAGLDDRTALLTAGDDYEILVAVAPENAPAFQAAAADGGITVTEIGSCREGDGRVTVRDPEGQELSIFRSGYDHFIQFEGPD